MRAKPCLAVHFVCIERASIELNACLHVRACSPAPHRIHPGEQPGGVNPSDHIECPHGCFLYETSAGETCLYRLSGGNTDDQFDRDGRLGHALVGLRESLVQSRALRQRLQERRTFQRRFARDVATLMIALALYYAVGCAVLYALEGWTIIEAAYFISVSMCVPHPDPCGSRDPRVQLPSSFTFAMCVLDLAREPLALLPLLSYTGQPLGMETFTRAPQAVASSWCCSSQSASSSSSRA